MSKTYEASMAIQILPNINDTTKKLAVIDKVIENIEAKAKKNNLNMLVGPFETVIEGNLEQVLELLKDSILIASIEGETDLLSFIKIAYNNSNSGVLSIDEKISKFNK
ncbi:MAG: thiamine-binding protein [bacterium]